MANDNDDTDETIAAITVAAMESRDFYAAAVVHGLDAAIMRACGNAAQRLRESVMEELSGEGFSYEDVTGVMTDRAAVFVAIAIARGYGLRVMALETQSEAASGS